MYREFEIAVVNEVCMMCEKVAGEKTVIIRHRFMYLYKTMIILCYELQAKLSILGTGIRVYKTKRKSI